AFCRAQKSKTDLVFMPRSSNTHPHVRTAAICSPCGRFSDQSITNNLRAQKSSTIEHASSLIIELSIGAILTADLSSWNTRLKIAIIASRSAELRKGFQMRLWRCRAGTVMGFRQACLREIGFFDVRYFAYGDDAEMSLRANRAGWKTAIVWDAIVKDPG